MNYKLTMVSLLFIHFNTNARIADLDLDFVKIEQ